MNKVITWRLLIEKQIDKIVGEARLRGVVTELRQLRSLFPKSEHMRSGKVIRYRRATWNREAKKRLDPNYCPSYPKGSELLEKTLQ